MRMQARVALALGCLAGCARGPAKNAFTPDLATAPHDLATTTGGDGGGGDGGSGGGGGGTCTSPVSNAPSVTLADFEGGVIPSSDTMAEGFRGSDVTNGTIIHPGANGTATAASFDYATSNAVFYQGMARAQYLDGSSTYHPDLANAIELWLQPPAGSKLLAATGATLGLWSYHWLHGDPWVGINATGGNLTDSQMHGYANFRVGPQAAGKWTHVVLSTSAFGQSRGNYHFYAARAVVQDQTFFGSLRQFELTSLVALGGGPTTLALDELHLVTRPPTASVCPASLAMSVKASGGDVVVRVQIVNPTAQARSYHVFVSSEVGLDRQTLETAMHDTDSVQAVDDLQGAAGADGGLGAVELFADDGSGHATGAAVVAAGTPISIAAGGTWRGVLVHHVTAAMRGSATAVTTGGKTYTVTRDTLTTSVIVWDPSEPRAGDVASAGAGSNADVSHPAPAGFPPFAAPPAGWASSDVPVDQVGGYFVSVLTLTP